MKNLFAYSSILIAFFLLSAGAKAQKRVDLKILGSSVAELSINNKFGDNPSISKWGYKIGAGWGYVKENTNIIPFTSRDGIVGLPDNPAWISIPLEVTYTLGQNSHKFEIGAGFVPFYSVKTEILDKLDKKHISMYGIVEPKYLYNKKGSSFLFGIGLDFKYQIPGLNFSDFYLRNFSVFPGLYFGYII